MFNPLPTHRSTILWYILVRKAQVFLSPNFSHLDTSQSDSKKGQPTPDCAPTASLPKAGLHLRRTWERLRPVTKKELPGSHLCRNCNCLQRGVWWRLTWIWLFHRDISKLPLQSLRGLLLIHQVQRSSVPAAAEHPSPHMRQDWRLNTKSLTGTVKQPR